MHMTDTIISTSVGAVTLAASAVAITYAASKTREEFRAQPDRKKILQIGAVSAFVFAAQMVNFAIPGTGSSGHFCGAFLLSALLGPYAGFLSITAILLIQSLMFADGGLLALGCNIINMGVFACFLVYPFVSQKILNHKNSIGRIIAMSMIGSVVSLQLGAFGVVLEALISGNSALPFSSFAALMQPVHLAIGLAEGVITAVVLCVVMRSSKFSSDGKVAQSFKKTVIGFTVLAILVGGVFSLLASDQPDGLEFSISKIAQEEVLTVSNPVYQAAQSLQETTALLPDYQLQVVADRFGEASGTSAAGIAGVLVTFLFTALVAFFIGRQKNKNIHGIFPQ